MFPRDYFQEPFFQGEYFGAAATAVAPILTDGSGVREAVRSLLERRREQLEEDDAEVLVFILGLIASM